MRLKNNFKIEKNTHEMFLNLSFFGQICHGNKPKQALTCRFTEIIRVHDCDSPAFKNHSFVL